MLRRLNPSKWGFRLPIGRVAPRWTHNIRHQTTQASRLDRITARLPRRLQKYSRGLRNAPVSHIMSFLILHELTAIVPLIALFALFHYTTFVPITYMTAHFGDYVQSGISRFEKYFRSKGYFGFRPKDFDEYDIEGTYAVEKWNTGEEKYKILVEVALAYAVTKVLLPLRIIASVWATPWFASVLLRMKRALMSVASARSHRRK
ncbi:uncharacterized protein UV8b_06735 [Ustilaginoidea virens]|uniref:Uncharacterized protein n=1 Tax=Ustilaginoidea virens TaxID=1159556 RepID=A0A063BVN9_USTVR|nr:uncharacterized protein UV8b_06735 [Ustilaginoidea virens]QUC22494.1 hypothetical protein UV8b_06735 [Ustilaginoidea virens]GAO18349.1 hypothetical protein UVI_02043960 [Ustilaginoidea virens]